MQSTERQGKETDSHTHLAPPPHTTTQLYNLHCTRISMYRKPSVTSAVYYHTRLRTPGRPKQFSNSDIPVPNTNNLARYKIR